MNPNTQTCRKCLHVIDNVKPQRNHIVIFKPATQARDAQSLRQSVSHSGLQCSRLASCAQVYYFLDHGPCTHGLGPLLPCTYVYTLGVAKAGELRVGAAELADELTVVSSKLFHDRLGLGDTHELDIRAQTRLGFEQLLVVVVVKDIAADARDAADLHERSRSRVACALMWSDCKGLAAAEPPEARSGCTVLQRTVHVRAMRQRHELQSAEAPAAAHARLAHAGTARKLCVQTVAGYRAPAHNHRKGQQNT
jgi:hypothetical protein